MASPGGVEATCEMQVDAGPPECGESADETSEPTRSSASSRCESPPGGQLPLLERVVAPFRGRGCHQGVVVGGGDGVVDVHFDDGDFEAGVDARLVSRHEPRRRRRVTGACELAVGDVVATRDAPSRRLVVVAFDAVLAVAAPAGAGGDERRAYARDLLVASELPEPRDGAVAAAARELADLAATGGMDERLRKALEGHGWYCGNWLSNHTYFGSAPPDHWPSLSCLETGINRANPLIRSMATLRTYLALASRGAAHSQSGADDDDAPAPLGFDPSPTDPETLQMLQRRASTPAPPLFAVVRPTDASSTTSPRAKKRALDELDAIVASTCPLLNPASKRRFDRTPPLS